MLDDRGPRMPSKEYDRCVQAAAHARTPEELAAIRDELLRRWRGDPRARDLAETLYVHQVLLSGGGASLARTRISEMRCAEALRRLPDAPGERSIALFDRGGLKVKMYAPPASGSPRPRARDEVWVVVQGAGTVHDGDSRRAVGVGDLLVVPAGSVGRFGPFTDDFAAWVIASGPDWARESAT